MRLEPLPDGFAATREALHRVAERIVAPARKPDNEIALTVTEGGFGTPRFEHRGASHRVRVEGPELVYECDDEVRRGAIESLAGAAELCAPLLGDQAPTERDPLGVQPPAAVRLGEFYGYAERVLERFRAGLDAADDASAIILWPEHFDLALEAGAEGAGARANYGASPGDAEHPEPYVYVGPWTDPGRGQLWNASAFPGAELGYAELLEASDPEALALEFLGVRHRALAG